jgi:hypothetical protein
MKLAELFLSAALAMAPVAAAQSGDVSLYTSIDDEGLVLVQVEGLNHVYARPGADLSRYTHIMLDPVEISFSESLHQVSAGTRVTVAEKQAIKQSLAKLLREALAKELVRSGHYSLVGAADEDVLRIKAELRDLHIDAPDLPRAGASPTYTISVDKMRLVTELRDAPTGALMARVLDFKKNSQAAWLKLAGRIDNLAAARHAAVDWARIIRAELDAAHGAGGNSWHQAAQPHPKSESYCLPPEMTQCAVE